MSKSNLELCAHRFKAMGSPCEFKYYAPSSADKIILSAAQHRLTQIEEKYTRYKPTSVTSQLNANAGAAPIDVDDETMGLLHYADTLYQQSDGLFDITSGTLRQVWDFRSNQLPSVAQLKPLLESIGWQKVHWQAPFFGLPDKNMEIDFGGFVKEYAADQVANVLRAQGVEHGLVNLGGDIVVIGPHPNGDAWQVGIQHPRLADKPIVQIPLTQGALATSGDYERFMMVNGERYSHLLNPNTGWPVKASFASVTIVADQCLLAGSFSSIAMLKSETNSCWLEDSGVAYLAVKQDMTLTGNIVKGASH